MNVEPTHSFFPVVTLMLSPFFVLVRVFGNLGGKLFPPGPSCFVENRPLRGFLQRILTSFGEFLALSVTVKKFSIPYTIPIAWKSSPQGNSGKVGVGAIICDHQGGWLIGSFNHIPRATSVGG
ncbi:hypothetical protein J1N35_031383 [Gossypium stocksii]|uniref:Uncharacterized protein n=1 Tax=Gossypium stocksii TaxID=47602 RepID=A0A9D3ZTN8_9ROSI|nr:hypothetical protein J1N35_031383 [Gossypium stocksii]